MCLSSASGRRTEMARRTFTMVDVTEILEHWYAGRPKVEVARSLGVDAKTVRRYVVPAEAAGMAPGGPPVTPEQWRALARQWFPHVAALEFLGGAPRRIVPDNLKAGVCKPDLY